MDNMSLQEHSYDSVNWQGVKKSSKIILNGQQ